MDDKSSVLDNTCKVIRKPSDTSKILKSSGPHEFNYSYVSFIQKLLLKAQLRKDVTFRSISTMSKHDEKCSDTLDEKSKSPLNTVEAVTTKTATNCSNETLRNDRAKNFQEYPSNASNNSTDMIKISEKLNICTQKACGIDCSNLPLSSNKTIALRQAPIYASEWIKPPPGSMKYIALAAFSGAVALGIDVYVKRCWRMKEHGLSSPSKLPTPSLESKETFSNANRTHLMHSILLMATPFVSKKPLIPFTLVSSGIIGFSGSNYYMTFHGRNKQILETAWIGGILLMIGWLSLVL